MKSLLCALLLPTVALAAETPTAQPPVESSAPGLFTGAAVDQVQAVCRRIEEVIASDPEAASYAPASIL